MLHVTVILCCCHVARPCGVWSLFANGFSVCVCRRLLWSHGQEDHHWRMGLGLVVCHGRPVVSRPLLTTTRPHRAFTLTTYINKQSYQSLTRLAIDILKLKVFTTKKLQDVTIYMCRISSVNC